MVDIIDKIEKDLMFSQNDTYDFYKKIHKKKYEKRIIKLNFNVSLLIFSGFLPLLVSLVSISNIIISNTYINALYFFSTFIIACVMVKVANRGFNSLDTYKKQFYLLYLMSSRLEAYQNQYNVKKGKNKMLKELYQIGIHFSWLIHDSLKFYRRINLFSINSEEAYLREFYICFEKQVMPNIKNGKYILEISDIITKLLNITYTLIPDSNNIDYLNKTRNIQTYSIKAIADCINDLKLIPIDDFNEVKGIKLVFNKIKNFFKIRRSLIAKIIFFIILLVLDIIIRIVTGNNDGISADFLVIVIAAFGGLLLKN